MKLPRSFRFHQELLARLDEASKVRGETSTAIVTRGLERELASGDVPKEEEAAAEKPANGREPMRDTLGVATWLARRTGQPVMLCRMFLSQGRVSIDGEVFTAGAIAVGELEDPDMSVTLDGDPV